MRARPPTIQLKILFIQFFLYCFYYKAIYTLSSGCSNLFFRSFLEILQEFYRNFLFPTLQWLLYVLLMLFSFLPYKHSHPFFIKHYKFLLYNTISYLSFFINYTVIMLFALSKPDSLIASVNSY